MPSITEIEATLKEAEGMLSASKATLSLLASQGALPRTWLGHPGAAFRATVTDSLYTLNTVLPETQRKLYNTELTCAENGTVLDGLSMAELMTRKSAKIAKNMHHVWKGLVVRLETPNRTTLADLGAFIQRLSTLRSHVSAALDDTVLALRSAPQHVPTMQRALPAPVKPAAKIKLPEDVVVHLQGLAPTNKIPAGASIAVLQVPVTCETRSPNPQLDLVTKPGYVLAISDAMYRKHASLVTKIGKYLLLHNAQSGSLWATVRKHTMLPFNKSFRKNGYTYFLLLPYSMADKKFVVRCGDWSF